MTIVIALKVGDGLVLGADSATTLSDGQSGYLNTYFNAEKLFHFDKRLPVGVLTYGLGGLAGRSISSHMKDLRKRLGDKSDTRFFMDATRYSVETAAARVREYFFTDLYSSHGAADPASPAMGFFIGGYSSTNSSAEVWEVLVEQGGQCGSPRKLIAETQACGANWQGLTEACSRLLLGYSSTILERLRAAGMPEKDALDLLNSAAPLLNPAMPIQDAIDLVDYLVEVSCGFVRFAPGTPAVAKPIDTAVITQHEGFRWIHRKHFYPREINLGHP